MATATSQTAVETLGTNHPGQGAFSPIDANTWNQAEFALGTHIEPGAGSFAASATFAVHSSHATRVLLEIYAQPMDSAALYDYWLAKGKDGVWRAKLASVPAGTFYGYRTFGPNWDFTSEWTRGNSGAGFKSDVDADGNRFNPNKLLMDPYAREFSHDRETPDLKERFGMDGGMYGSGPGIYAGADGNLSVTRREFDTGPWAPKSILIQDHTSFGKKPRLAQKDAIIYEAHLKGFTRHPTAAQLADILKGLPDFAGVKGVPDSLRGTYAGAGHMAKYLKAMGYTTVEFLPVHEFANDMDPEEFPGWDRRLDDPPHGNYWGYMTYGFFAPDRRYAHDQSSGGPTREFKKMVKAFHDEGLEVYLDVVYNHTGEGGLWDGTGDTAELLAFRGLDNADYYTLTEGNRFYWDSTGCGNNLDASKLCVQNFIKDSLKYWSLDMGVDGFRFDLATVLGRTGANHDFQTTGQLLEDIATLAETEQIKIIAEAWDLGEDDVGKFPLGWAEWDGIYRDAVRKFLKGDGSALEFIRSVNGDYSQFQDQGGPQKSISLLTAHDGFTLLDLVSYNAKNNDASWPFGPSDGGNDNNMSWDSGGDLNLRRQRLRNFLVVQFFSRGIPMTCGGDEFGRTQNGNNNPYKIDSVATWQNYGMIATPHPTGIPTGASGTYHDNYGRDTGVTGKNGLFLFSHFLIQFRKTHTALRQDRYADLALDSGGDVTFFFKGQDGLTDLQVGDRRIHWHINGSQVGDTDFLLLLNMGDTATDFMIPKPASGKRWVRIIDTAAWAEPQGNYWPTVSADTMGDAYGVNSWSVAVFQEIA